ncbi:nitronate monooxygenase [Oligella urethralis]|uniref:NAD(P)H-dependent flavin oxidoreductase n=1 Tax=Oligella urethralis TaxID=90245 RepID=UPI000CFFBC7B|nr:nitronate monooxygenase family protein [Oligella urethralis]AVL71942.1 nitronate monooxygenase [Oligella urethralis]
MSFTRANFPEVLTNLRLPLIAAPMFTVSYPELVLAQAKAGIVASFPALNAREDGLLDHWLNDINADLKAYQQANPEKRVGAIAVNIILHDSNRRLAQDLAICVKHRVPIIITSLRAPSPELIAEVHSYGGIVLHDVINLRHAQKAIDAGVDGLILVAAGAGGHGGTLSPMAMVAEVKQRFDGVIILSGAIATGDAILAAQVMGADLAYMGTRFVASEEARAVPAYKEALLRAKAADILYTDYFTGVHGNYLKESIIRAGLDPAQLQDQDKNAMNFIGDSAQFKAWKDIWGAGQGVGLIDCIEPVAAIVAKLEKEYVEALDRVCALRK